MLDSKVGLIPQQKATIPFGQLKQEALLVILILNVHVNDVHFTFLFVFFVSAGKRERGKRRKSWSIGHILLGIGGGKKNLFAVL